MMKKYIHVVFWAGLFASVLTAGCTCPPTTVLEQTALVRGFWEDRPDYCKFNFNLGPGASEEDDLKKLHLRAEHSRFKLKNRRMEESGSSANESGAPLPVDYLNVHWNVLSQIQDPDMRVLHDEKDPLESDYCKDGGDLSQHVYAFGIHDLKNPRTGKTNPHAFIYIPMNLEGKAHRPLGNRYYVAILSIEEKDPSGCQRQMPDYPRCVALSELAVMQQQGMPGKDFRIQIDRRILLILPATNPYKMPSIDFHNGVIHGNL